MNSEAEPDLQTSSSTKLPETIYLIERFQSWPDRAIAIAAVALCFAIFAVDLLLPLGVAGGVPYVAAVMLSLGSQRGRLVIGIAILASVLTLAGMALSPQGSSSFQYVIANRLIAMFAIWAAAVGVRIQLQTQTRLLDAQIRLREKDALAQLGEMAAVVAHEVKNPLAGISGALQILRFRFPEGSSDRRIIAQLLERIDQLSVSLHSLLDFARPQPLKRAPVSIHALLQETITHLSAAPELNTEVDIQGEDVTVHADPVVLGRALLNLVLNAAQAMSGEGTLIIRVQSDGSSCQIEFIDSGPGIPTPAQKKVFQPFFTTRIHGTGLGLAIVQKTIAAHNGEVWLKETHSEGTTMAIRLPCWK